MRNLFIIITVMTAALSSNAQTAHFSYDASGNRTNRWLEVKEIKQAEADTAEFILPELRPTEEAELLSEVKVYPNPVQHELHIDISRLGDATATGHLCDISGRPVLSFENLTAANTLNVETLAPGTYLLRVECKGERRVWKVVVSGQ